MPAIPRKVLWTIILTPWLWPAAVEAQQPEEPKVACCLDSNVCTDLTEAECMAAGAEAIRAKSAGQRPRHRVNGRREEPNQQ